MLVYIHVPFCRSKCKYCAFHSLPSGQKDHERISRYTATLLREITLWGERLGKRPVTSVFFGGGTPSLLPVQAVERIMQHLETYFAFDAHMEITMEANPESALAPGWLAGARAAGINRISLGVQSFDDNYLHILGRAHNARTAMMAWEAIQNTHFTSASLDLMWGLPDTGSGQTLSHWAQSLHTAASMGPQHLSCYCLTLEEGSVLAKECEQGRLTVPDDETLAGMFLHTHTYLSEQGITPYEIANFARQGHQCRHNAGYWACEEYLGFGPAAASMLTRASLEYFAPSAGRINESAARWTNPYDHHAWEQEVAQRTARTSKTMEYEELSPGIRLQELTMLGLRTVQGLDILQWEQQAGVSFNGVHGLFAAELEQAHLARRTAQHLALTPQGMLRANTIIEQMFSLQLPYTR